MPTARTADLDIIEARVRLIVEFGILVFEQDVAGMAGATVPAAAGGMDGAPVVGYVFPTSLSPETVGFPTESSSTRIGWCWSRTRASKAGWL